MSIALFDQYRLKPGDYDELWLDQSEIRPHWRPFIDALGELDLLQVRTDIQRLLQENGVTYNVHNDPSGQPRDWQLDVVPLIISEDEWAEIEAGIQQRGQLLNLILRDLYGPQTLIREGMIPPELIFMHDGFLRPIVGMDLAAHPLMIYAADLGRGPDGRMWVLGDRTQAPSGMGYALENRTVMARTMSGMFAEGKIRRLSNFFRQFRTTLQQSAFHHKDAPQVAVLTPGPYNETYFEHAYLASYLGFALVQGSDLTVRDGQLWLKTLAGLRQVDVVVRRVDDLWCDPLELYDHSQLGVAGLLESIRRQHVRVANPLGSGVLENPGLMPFLPGLARHFLDQDLILPAAATWWCGQPQELNHVLDNLSQMVVKTIARSAETRTIFGSQLTRKELDSLRDRILQNPTKFVGQEQVGFSTVPSLVNGHLEARHTVLRTFAVGTNSGYAVMPGGLTRSAAGPRDFMVSGQADGISRDTWVLTSEPETYSSLWLQTERLRSSFEESQSLPSRAAENLFWVGRYAERSEATARLLRAIFDQSLQAMGHYDKNRILSLHQLLRALTHITNTYPGFVGDDEEEPELLLERFRNPRPELISMMFDADRYGSLLNSLKALTRSANAVRSLWSSDNARVLDRLDQRLERFDGGDSAVNGGQTSLPALLDMLNALITQLMAFAGLNAESTTRGHNWLLLDSGRRLERAVLLTSFIRATLTQVYPAPLDTMICESVLTTTENIITYRRRYHSYLHIQTVLEQLLLDETNPRGLIYQLDQLQHHLRHLPRPSLGFRMSYEQRAVLDAATRLRLM